MKLSEVGGDAATADATAEPPKRMKLSEVGGDAQSATAPPDGFFTGFLKQIGSAAQTAWQRVQRGEGALTGTPNVLSQNSEIMRQQPQYRPGMKMGEMMPKNVLENPMVGAFGTGNIGARMPMRNPAPAATERLQDFTQQGVRPNVPVIGQGRAAGLTAQAGRVLPFSPVRKGFEQTLADTAAAAERNASGFGAATDEFAAGGGARNALRGYAADRSQATKDYGDFFRLMHGAPPVSVDRTLNVLRDFRGRFPNAPGLTGIFTNPKLSRLAQELEPQTKTIPAKTSPIVDQFGRPSTVTPAQTVTTGGKLSMPELRELRTQIGYMLENPSFGPENIPRAQLKQLYGALTADMRKGANTPAARRALSQATINYGTRMRTLDRLEPLISPDAPEKVFSRLEQASRTSGSADAGLLQAAKNTMPPDAWGNVGAAVIRRMGNPSPGQAKTAGMPEFSTNTYATNWNKMSGRSKDLLYGPDVPGSPRAGLEQLSRVVNAQKAVGNLANTSRTFEVGAAGGMVVELLNAVAQGRVPIRELNMYAGAMGAAQLMMSPAFTRWLYKLPNVAAQSGSTGQFQDAALNALQAGLREGALVEAGKERSAVQRPSPQMPGQGKPRPLEFPAMPAASP